MIEITQDRRFRRLTATDTIRTADLVVTDDATIKDLTITDTLIFGDVVTDTFTCNGQFKQGTNAVPLVLTAGTPLFTLYSTNAGTSGSTSAEPFYVKSTLTGAGQVGGRSRFHTYSNVASGGWINALKSYMEFGAAGSSTGLASSMCVEMTAPNQTVPGGQYYPLEIEQTFGESTSVAGTAGSGAGFIYAKINGTATNFEDEGGFFWLDGVTSASGNMYYGATIRVYVTSSMTERFLVMSTAENALNIGTSAITCGSVAVDNLNLDANDISSTSGDINITPVAGSDVVIDGHFEFDGADMTALTDNNTIITAYAGKNITIESVTFDGGAVGGVLSLGLTGSPTTAITLETTPTTQILISGASTTGISITGAATTALAVTAAAGETILNIDAGTTDHTGANLIVADLDVNSASCNFISADIDVGTALDAAEYVRGVSIDIAGNGGDDAGAGLTAYYATGATDSGAPVLGVELAGAWDTGIAISGTSTTGIAITGSATTAISIATGTFATGILVDGTLTTGINIGTCSGASIHFAGGADGSAEGDFWYNASAHAFQYRDNTGVKTIAAS